MNTHTPFISFIQAGFECSTQRLRNGRRLDIVDSTFHDRFVFQDYARLNELGIRTVREGARWHLIHNEEKGRTLDFSSVMPFLAAAKKARIQIVWDLFHFGWPEQLEIVSPEWVEEFSRYCLEFAKLLRDDGQEAPLITPLNEISFFAWAGGDVAYLNPFETGRGWELKAQLVRAWIAAAKAIRSVLPQARMVSAEPVIHIIGDPGTVGAAARAEAGRRSMFEAWDMILGRSHPSLGGSEEALDVIGVNYYDRNQRVEGGRVLHRCDPEFRPFREILLEIYEKYRRPMLVSETGTEGEERPAWFAYIMDETRRAISMGVPVKGVCLYPVLNHPGWDDDRHCENGVWDYPSANGERPAYGPLHEEIRRQQILMKQQSLMSPQTSTAGPDLVCFSHLRWNFVFQRPQHLMSRFARDRRVFYLEEPVTEPDAHVHLRVDVCWKTGVRVVTPVLPQGLSVEESHAAVTMLVNQMFEDQQIERYIAWYYTPMALEYRPALKPVATVYDCMDELSLFQYAPPALKKNELALFHACDMVFTGGISLFEAKRSQHERVYPFPSSVDAAHFLQARSLPDNAEDQKFLPRPRLGYAGVIDERIDMDLIRQMAEQRPTWQFVMIGPVVKIDPSVLPRLSNIHWLGGKPYGDLPAYLAGWDIALMPFALNDATRFISPTKTPEYLAAGLPVISTPIHDVVRQYGELGMVQIAKDASGFVSCAEEVLTHGEGLATRHRVDGYLQTLSWESTWQAMNDLLAEAVAANSSVVVPIPQALTAASHTSVSYV